MFLVPRDISPKVKTSFDLIGILLLSPMFALFIYGISQVGTHGGYGNTAVLAPVLLGVLLLTAFVFYALRTKNEPVIDVKLFKSRNFTVSTVMMFMSGIATNGVMLLLPLYYQQVRGESILMTGVMMIPQGVGMLLTHSRIGRLTDKIGARVIVLVSLVVTVLGTIPFAFAEGSTSNILLMLALLVRGAGLGGIKGVQTFHDDASGKKRGKNIVYNFTIDGLNVCHCGDLGHLLSPEQINEIGKADILLLPIGGRAVLNASGAAEVMKQLNPTVVIPMHYKTKAIGILGFIFGKVDTLITVSKKDVINYKELDVDSSNIRALPGIVVLQYN
jgi:hypothetical protein